MSEPHFSIEVTTAPSVVPVTTAQIRTHVNQNHTDDDTYLDALVAAATRHVQKYTGLYLITQTLTIRYDEFPSSNGQIVLPLAPVSAINSVKYLDQTGTEQTLSATLYDEDLKSLPPRIYPAYAEVWPVAQCIQNAVRIEVVAGYGAAGSDCPASLIHAIKLLAGHWYRNREAVVDRQVYKLPSAVEALLDAERINWL